jgi:ankyrin repeat protein
LLGVAGVRPVAAAPVLTTHTARQNASALLDAVKAGDLPAVQAALAAGADVNRADDTARTPLMLAAGLGRTDLVQLLLDNKADVNARDAEGRTALHQILAAANNAAPPKKKRGFSLGNLGSVAGALGGGGGLGDLAGNLAKGSLLQGLAAKGLGKSLLSMGNLQTLLAPGATFDLGSKNNWTTVLGAALSGGDNNLASDIANLNTKDAAVWTRLLQNANKNQPGLLSALSNVSTAQSTGKEQWAAFVQSAVKGDTRGVQRLMGDGSLAGLLGDAGTGLSAALNALPGKDGGAGIARLLLDRGANATLADAKGETPLKRAQSAGLSVLAGLLETAGAAPR